MSIQSKLKTLKGINPWKTLYFNFHYFQFKTAIKMPFFIFWRSKLSEMKGKIIIDAPVKTGMVKFSPHNLGTQDPIYSRSIWQVTGNVIIKGKVCIGRGSSISVGQEATLTFGDNFIITGNSTIICQKEISFGTSCLLSWDILVMDTDFHNIVNRQGQKLNPSKAIKIGNHVWIGCRSTILKGVTVANDIVIAANSAITKDATDEHCVIGGHAMSAMVLKRDIDWAE